MAEEKPNYINIHTGDGIVKLTMTLGTGSALWIDYDKAQLDNLIVLLQKHRAELDTQPATTVTS